MEMDSLGRQEAILENIDVPTNELKTSSIQNVLKEAKRFECQMCVKCYECASESCSCPHMWNAISAKLFDHLLKGFPQFDDHLLCASAFYTALAVSDQSNKQHYLDKVLQIVDNELTRKKNGNAVVVETVTAVVLMYGIFQSSFLTPVTHEMYRSLDSLNFEPVLKTMTELIFLMAYDYSKFTYIIFKTMASFANIYGYPFQAVVFSRENVNAMLNVIVHNWENPITGVRDLIKKIYGNIINYPHIESPRYIYFDENKYGNRHHPFCNLDDYRDMREFCENKAKCLMLTEHIKASPTLIRCDWDNWVYPFVCSTLLKPGLVAAGADLYYALLEKTQNQEEWCSIYLERIVNILNGSSEKAIENFTDYWCLPTLKKIPQLTNVIITKLGDLDESEKKLFSGLSLLKQANKLGFLKENWGSEYVDGKSFEKCVLSALDHCNTKVRMLAFDIVCVSQTKRMPTKLEYGLVINYLHNNINSDCRVLRINMMKSLTKFLEHLHGSYMSIVKNKQEFNHGDLFNFCSEYQELIVSSLNINGNYQRKITSIQLVDTFLTSFSQIQRKGQKEKQPEFSLMVTLKENDQLTLMKPDFMKTLLTLTNDAADDVRENAANLLYKHFTDQLRDTLVFNELIDRAQHCLSGKFFYEISCGHIKFKLILKILSDRKVSGATFKSIEDVFDYGFKSLDSEYESGRGVVESIEKGKQLHSFITLLHDVFEVCLEKKYFISVSSDKFNKLLAILEGVSNQFAWEQDDTSSDFCRMNDMVQDLIQKSGCSFTEDARMKLEDETKLSSLHQIVLNCLWMNVKASCELAAMVVQYHSGADSDVCERALRVITRVLETCRHKGAIEAAGVALGKSVRHLTSTARLSALPQRLLESRLQEFTRSGAMASVTRRGAGLSIMLHRIVASDARRDKPLFELFMKTVLEACNESDQTHTPAPSVETDIEKDIPKATDKEKDIGKSADTEKDIGKSTDTEKDIGKATDTEKDVPKATDTEKDVPKAVYIHFLTRIVTDSSLTCDVLYHADKLAELAFGNLTSPQWQIRNAALQLYGALLPKLIGQKKPSTDDEPAATVACDELRTHLPKLWQHMMDTLNDQSQSVKPNELEHHSSLVPILNVLASCGKRYNFRSDLFEQKDADSKLLESLKLLLESRIHIIRKLAAKAIYNIFHRDAMKISIWGANRFKNQNAFNGYLILAELYRKDCTDDFSSIWFDRSTFARFIYDDNESYAPQTPLVRNYINKLQFLQTFPYADEHISKVGDTLYELQKYSFAPGIDAWAERAFELGLSTLPWEDIPQCMKIIMNLISVTNLLPIRNPSYYKEFQSETYCEIIFKKLEQATDVPKQVLLEMANVILTTYKTIYSTITWRMLYEISKRVDPKQIASTSIVTHLNGTDDVGYTIRYMVPVAAIIVPVSNEKALSRLSSIIFSWTDLKTTDYDKRYVAALSVNELAKRFTTLPEDVKISAIKSAIMLLQDEDEDIRNTTVQFYKNLIKANKAPQPYICLSRILDRSLSNTILTREGVENLCEQLMRTLNDLSSSKKVDEYNPFANEASNIYMETDVLKKLVEQVKVHTV